MVDRLVIGIDISDKDVPTLSVAIPKDNGLNFINIFYCQEAIDIYEKLTGTKVEGKESDDKS